MNFDFRRYNLIATADFETSTEAWNVEEARVWLWDICYGEGKHISGTDLDSFMYKILKSPNKTLYGFRNLAYDGTYIISWLLRNGYKHTLKDTEAMGKKTFKCVVSEMGQHYAYQICNENMQHVTIMDTLKYVNMSIEASAKCYNLPILKGTLDYDTPREIGHIPTKEELDYIHNDTEIDYLTIKLNVEQGAFKFTQAGNAKYEFKKLFSKGEWDSLFPEIDKYADTFMRKAYCGGFVSYEDSLKNKVVEDCTSYDINSMYPAQMLHREMPYGEPMSFDGRYVKNKKYPLFIQKIKCCFSLKKDGIAMIASRRAFINKDNVYIKDSSMTVRELTLSSPDFELFFDNYEVWNIEWCGGFMFQAMKGYEVTPEEASKLTVDEVIELDGKGSYFYEYIKKWRYIKEHEPSGTPARDYAKRMQNALYGALATNPERKSSIPYLDENGIVKYKVEKSTDGKSAYLPAGIFITAWSRHFLINAIKKNRKNFVYCDTDSLYLINSKDGVKMSIHKSLYGFFKIEHYITKMKVVGSKRYIYYGREPNDKEDKLYVTCCGADSYIKSQMNFDTFNQGAVFYGKKSVRNVKGGKHIFITTYKLGKPPAV